MRKLQTTRAKEWVVEQEWVVEHKISKPHPKRPFVQFGAVDVVSAAAPRRGFPFCGKLLVMAAGCLVAVMAWGKSFSIDLRQPAAKDGVRTLAKRNAVSAVAKESDCLRRVNLGAGAADVGRVVVGDELTFALFDDVSVTLALKRQMPSPLGGDAFLAEVSGYDEGVKSAVVLRTADGLTVDLQDYRNKKVYKVISTVSGVTVQEMEAKVGKCGCNEVDPPKQTGLVSAKIRRATKAVAKKGADGGVACVDILVAYDKNAATWANSNGGGVTNFAQIAVQKMNTALANTGLDARFRFRLVGVTQISVSTDNLNTALDAATEGQVGWEPIGDMRDEVGADIVTVLIDTGTAEGITGIGWRLSSFSQYDIEAFSAMAYNACAIRSVAQSHTMTHEVGHNMGCGHSDIQTTDPGPQLFSYSSGYYFSARGKKYHTIMAYGTEGRGGAEVPYFSSPHYTYMGVAVGDYEHNNAQTLVDTHEAVSRWGTTDVSRYAWETEPCEDGCVITSVSPAPVGHLSIPAKVGGKAVVAIGERAFHDCVGLRSVTIPEGVTDIGTWAFQYCYGLRSVSIPDSVTRIGNGAFHDCRSLTSVVIPDGVTIIENGLFDGCSDLVSVEIPDSVSEIGGNAFGDCRGLTSMTLSSNVTTIVSGAFSGCTGLQRLDVAEDNPRYSCVNGLLCDKNATRIIACPAGLANVTIPDSVTYLEGSVFAGCENLVAVTLPPSVKYILGAGTFYGCDRLQSIIVQEGNPSYTSIDGVLYNKEVTKLVVCPPGRERLDVPNGIVGIGWGACSGGNLRSVSLPSSLEEIESRAFESCENLSEVDFPDGMRKIGSGAFWNCPSLSRIFIPASVRYFGSNDEGGFDFATVNNLSPVIDVDENNPFYSSIGGVLYNKDKTTLFRCPAVNTEVDIPASVTKIGEGAFENCERIFELEIPESVTEIGSYAFSGTGLLRLRIPQGVISLGGNFQCNLDIETVMIPPGAEINGTLSFYHNSRLQSIYLPESMKGLYSESSFADSLSENLKIVWYSGEYPKLPTKTCTVYFDAPEATMQEWKRSLAAGTEIGTLPVPSRPGYTFEGWRIVYDKNGEKWTINVLPSTRIYKDSTCFAEWTLNTQEVCTVTFNANGGSLRGADTSRTVAMGGAVGKLPTPTRSGYMFAGWYTAENGGTRVTSSTKVTSNMLCYARWIADGDVVGIAGFLDLDFVRAQTMEGALYRDGALVGTMQVKIGKVSKKGTVKVSAAATLLMDGKAKKITAKAVNVMLAETGSVPPVPIAFKAPIGEMMFEMGEDGTFTLKNSSYVMSIATIGGALQGGSQGTFRLQVFDFAVPGEIQDGLLPYEVTFGVSGARWSFAKAATVKWVKDRETKAYGLVVDDTKGKTNLSGLKLTYVAKKGIFKGSFKAYALEEKNGKTKLKKYTVSVIGLVVDGKGVGEASCKRPIGGPWPVTAE